jgi:hypothetical protein
VQVLVVVSTELERIAIHINQLDARALPPLVLEPFLVESDRYSHAVLAFAITVHVAHLESTERSLFAFHFSYQLTGVGACISWLFLSFIIVEAPCKRC